MSFIKINNTIYFEYKYNEIFSNEIIILLNECYKIYFNNYDDYNICFDTNNMWKSNYNRTGIYKAYILFI